MREIKFRALDENDEWIYGMPLTHVEYEEKEFPLMRNCDETGYWGIKKIHPKTLGQYTGLKDENGVEIYEGDIVTSNLYPFQSEGKYNYHGLIEWDSEMAMYILGLHLVNGKKRGISHGVWTPISDYHTDSFEVIGNIYENPELLECEPK